MILEKIKKEIQDELRKENSSTKKKESSDLDPKTLKLNMLKILIDEKIKCRQKEE